MKKPVSPHTAVFLLLCTIAPLSAQNLASIDRPSDVRPLKVDDLEGNDSSSFSGKDALPGEYAITTVRKATAQITDDRAVYAAQDSMTLETTATSSKNVESVVDLDVLRQPSVYRKVYVSTSNGKGQPYKVSDTALEDGLAQITAVYRQSGKAAGAPDCPALALSVEKRIKMEPAKLLELVESEVEANPGCACEVVKAAIRTTNAETSQVVSIVETAIHAAPESMRVVSQCAIAESPDSLSAIQALLAKLDPNSGNAGTSAKSAKSSKDAKDSKVATVEPPVPPNPLDLPTPFPPIIPPPVYPPLVTDVDPRDHNQPKD